MLGFYSIRCPPEDRGSLGNLWVLEGFSEGGLESFNKFNAGRATFRSIGEKRESR